MINFFEESVETAYDNRELHLLLCCDEKYNKSQMIGVMASDIKLVGGELEEQDPVNFESITSAMEYVYCKLGRKVKKKEEFKDDLVGALKYMLESKNADKVYFATKLYFILGNRANVDSFYPLRDINLLLKKKVAENLYEKQDLLRRTQKYEGLNEIDGLWAVIKRYNYRACEEVKVEIFE